MQNNPNYNKFVKPEGYTDLGWQITISNETYKKCFEQGHVLKEFDNSNVLSRLSCHSSVINGCGLSKG
mgnify:CR=1 FL=1